MFYTYKSSDDRPPQARQSKVSDIDVIDRATTDTLQREMPRQLRYVSHSRQLNEQPHPIASAGRTISGPQL